MVGSARLSPDTILSPVSEELQSVQQHMREALDTGFPELDQCSAYVIDGGGKRLRAALVLLCSSLKGPFPDGVIRLAAGAELVHAATLLHDDVIDNASLRRGRPSVSRKWGNREAVLLGDFMLAKAIDIAVSIGRKDLYSPLADAARDMVMGEFLQNRHAGAEGMNAGIYTDIIEKKTGAFMGACCCLGASFAGLPAAECEELRLFGVELGCAFQIIDDTLDFSADDAVTGKDAGNDFFTGKVTLPVIYALEAVPAGARDEIIRLFAVPTEEGRAKLNSFVKNTGALERCSARAGEIASRAASRLEVFPGSVSRGILADLSRFIVERVY